MSALATYHEEHKARRARIDEAARQHVARKLAEAAERERIARERQAEILRARVDEAARLEAARRAKAADILRELECERQGNAPPKGFKQMARGHVLLIKEQVCAEFGVTIADIDGPHRLLAIVRARQKGMWLAWKAGFSTPEIGRQFGGRDHSTVMHAVRKMQRLEAERGGQ